MLFTLGFFHHTHLTITSSYPSISTLGVLFVCSSFAYSHLTRSPIHVHSLSSLSTVDSCAPTPHCTTSYDRGVQTSGIDGWMCTAATLGNVHEVNLRDKTIIAWALDQLDMGALDLKSSCDHAPFNVMSRW